jgi:uncharacterized coiled-coil protein SlyX
MPVPGAMRILARVVAEDLALLLDEIELMLREPPTGGPDAVARVEDTLTDGYARALELEAERWRIERRLAELARHLATDEDAVEKMSGLSGRLEHVEDDLRHLRDRLGSLRRHADAVRAA